MAARGVRRRRPRPERTRSRARTRADLLPFELDQASVDGIERRLPEMERRPLDAIGASRDARAACLARRHPLERGAGGRFLTSRLGAKGETFVPEQGREAARAGPGHTIRNARVMLMAMRRPLGLDDPFACSDEWAAWADAEGCASL